MPKEGPDKPEHTPADKAAAPQPQEGGESARPEADPFGEPFDEETATRWSRLTRRLIDRGEDARYLLGTVLDTSDKAKTEVVRMVAREVRNYLEALRLEEDIREFLTSHTLEVQASFSLKPLADKIPEPPPEDEEAPDEDPK